jgi:hypothetical protein
MITFILGALAAVAGGVLGWLSVSIIGSLKRVKSLENENQVQWRDIEERYNSIERKLDEAIDIINRRVDDNYSYTDSRFDKFNNHIERNYVSKIDKNSNTISYNN